MFKRKPKPIKASDDIRDSMIDLTNRSLEFLATQDVDDNSEQIRLIYIQYLFGEIDEIQFGSRLRKLATPSQLNNWLFISGIIEFEEYEKTRLSLRRDEHMQRAKETDGFVERYANTQEMVERDYQRSLNALDLRLGKLDFIDYEIADADLMNQPYAKVFFTPSKENESQLNVDVRFNSKFIEILSKREGFQVLYDDEGNIEGDTLIEQWFHTAIIVMAGNMLKESDMDFFRSLTSEHPGAELVKRMEFDPDNLPEDIREELGDRFNNHGYYQ